MVYNAFLLSARPVHAEDKRRHLKNDPHLILATKHKRQIIPIKPLKAQTLKTFKNFDP
jgi:hypothetical protein